MISPLFRAHNNQQESARKRNEIVECYLPCVYIKMESKRRSKSGECYVNCHRCPGRIKCGYARVILLDGDERMVA